MATSVLGLKTFAASDPVDYNEVNDNYVKIDGGVKTAMQGRAAHNLLDNSDFQINQRGKTSYTSHGYTVDRWTASSLTVGSSGVTITSTNSSSNILEQDFIGLKDGTYTFAAKVNGEIKTRVCSVSGTTVTTIDNSNAAYNGGYLSFDYSSAYNVFFVSIRANAGGNSVSVEWAALYEGSYTADTLPAYQPKGYAAELAECMRYYQVFGKKRIVQSTEPNGGFTISERFPIAMRVAPTITGTYVAWATLASGPAAVVEKTDRLSTSESRADGFMGYYFVGIATEMMILDYAFTASADL